MNDLREIHRQAIKLKCEVAAIRAGLKFAKLTAALKAGFNPDQARDEFGRWSDGGASSSENQNADSRFAAKGNEAACEKQYKLDSAICRLVQTNLCWRQAMARRAACISGYPLPPLNF
jgi:hypothetical protein